MKFSQMVEFEWPVDQAGYEIVEIPPVRLNALTPHPPPDGMTKPVTDVVAKGGTVRTQRLFEASPALFMELAETPKTHDGVLAFANKYGLLVNDHSHQPGLDNSDVDDFSNALRELRVLPEDIDARLSHFRHALRICEPLRLWYATIGYLRALLSLDDGNPEFLEFMLKGGALKDFCKMDLGLSRRHGVDMPTLVFRPKDLYGAIMLQTAMHLMSPNAEINRCEMCNGFFPVGRGTGKKSNAIYCSRQCADRAHYALRKERQRSKASAKA